MTIEEQDKLQEKRRELAEYVNSLQYWLSKNKEHSDYKENVIKYHDKIKELRIVNEINKTRGHEEALCFNSVIIDSLHKEVYNRVKQEVTSRLNGGKPKSISLLLDSDENKLHKLDKLEKDYKSLRLGILTILKDIDNIMLPTKSNMSPEMYNSTQNFNKHILKSKRTLNELLTKTK